MYYRMCSIRYVRPERAIKGAVEVAAEKKRFSTRDKASGRVSYANATCLVVSSVTTIDGGNSPSSPLGRRQLSLWLKPSRLHAKQTKRQNQERKCKKMDLQR